MYVTSWALLRTETIFFKFCMSDSGNFYGQIPSNLFSVCQRTGFLTYRFRQVLNMYVTCWTLLRTETVFFKFCMSVSWNSYVQIPASFKNVCNLLSVITYRNRILLILYVSFLEFLRTDSNKLQFCMSVD